MIAGFGAFFEQEYKLPAIVGSGILSGLCFVTLMTNTNGVVKANQILTPVLILFIIIIGIINVCTGGGIGKNITCSNGNFVLSAVLYCSYNSICIIPVLVTLRKYIKTKKQALWASLICGAVICILAIIIYFLLGRIDGNIEGFEMPAVYAVSCIFENLKNVYAFIILASIYTTNITLGMSLLENVSSSRKCYVCVTAILCFTSVLVSQFGFSNLVSLLYPVFGYLGLIQLFLICVADNNLK
jgi:uncharacterized membrane protein YkvI